ncbi:hypothetical protein JN531_012695 [Flagellatimonas centrodinii]|uniref:glycoside hydrolase family 108 protein n=1 Tax=Flagellatimonas centrodinii TaxID=2806210 RepID=UPI001FEF2182|nr:glycosyl hydrolase 108 family protein [Flagellatimonas centrodinii]ULQ45958.1 hypothetical protein JN531_012695 [Flagellatimonas centrodinii]
MKSPRSIIDDIIRAEGDRYTNDPSDSGGPTRWGITQATLSRYRGRAVTPNEVAALTRDEAAQIYERMYWIDPGLHLLGEHSMLIAAEVMDTGVNCPMRAAVTMLQRQLNVHNDRGRHYADLVVDGRCGAKTAEALQAFLARRGTLGEQVLFVALNGMQVAYYTELAERREKDERWLWGWLRVRVADQVREGIGHG